ncbi:unnamed protein product, partial [Meganyctiphanes norvegica]
IASEYALIKKQLQKKERKLKKFNNALQAKEHVRRTVEVYTRKKSPYKDPKVPDAVKFKEGSPEVRVIHSVTSPVKSLNAKRSKKSKITLENNFVPSKTINFQKKLKNCNDISNKVSSTSYSESNKITPECDDNGQNCSKQSNNKKYNEKKRKESENIEIIKKNCIPSSFEVELEKSCKDDNSSNQLCDNEILHIHKKHMIENDKEIILSLSSKSDKKINKSDSNSSNCLRKKLLQKAKSSFKYPRINGKSILDNIQSQDLFAPTLAPSSSNVFTVTDKASTSEASIPLNLNENLKTNEINTSIDNELQNDFFTDTDFQTLPLNSQLSLNEVYKNNARDKEDKYSSMDSHELISFSNDQFFSQNIDIVRRGKSRKRTPRSSQDSLVSNEKNKRISGITTSYEDVSTNKTISLSSENNTGQHNTGFLNYREPIVNSSIVTNNTSEDVLVKELDDYSNSLEAFAMDFDEMLIESNSEICNKNEREDELIILEAEKVELNRKNMQDRKKHVDSVNANVQTKNVIIDSKFSLLKNKQSVNDSCDEISITLNKKNIDDSNLKTNEDKKMYKKIEIPSYKFPIQESQGKVLICAINVHNLDTSGVDNGIKKSIPTVLVIQEFGLSLWQYYPKAALSNQHSKDNFRKSWQEIGKSNYNFGKSTDIIHIVANGLPSIEKDVRFYVITKK